jgi:hypothetical protein
VFSAGESTLNFKLSIDGQLFTYLVTFKRKKLLSYRRLITILRYFNAAQ